MATKMELTALKENGNKLVAISVLGNGDLQLKGFSTRKCFQVWAKYNSYDYVMTPTQAIKQFCK